MSVTTVVAVKDIFVLFESLFHGYDSAGSAFDSSHFSIPRAEGSKKLQGSFLQTGVRNWGPNPDDHSPVAKVVLTYWERIPIGDFTSQQGIAQGNMSKVCERVASTDFWEDFNAFGVLWVNTIEDVEVGVEQIGNLVKLTIQFVLWIK